jgi:succinate dehydrogenase / fumarate reductase iron-sulfur subunit
MKITLHIWRQANKSTQGHFVTYSLEGVQPEMSFLEMLDYLNETLLGKGLDPVAFDHDCREGICGMCSLVINGIAHGPLKGTTTCQLHMRSFKDGEEIYIEPWRAQAFPVLKDLTTDRSGLDKIIQSGGFVSVNSGNAQDANNILISKQDADISMDAAACIGCGACVAACKNSSAMLFVAAKVSQLAHLPQGLPEKSTRVVSMINQMEESGFGACSNTYECTAVCPKEIAADHIAKTNREYISAQLRLFSN